MQIRKYSMERNSNSLQSICYSHGSLQLLDQVPLSQFKSNLKEKKKGFYFDFIFGLYNSQKATISLLNLDFVVVVFEQRKLPLEVIYLDIKDATDGW